MKVRCVASVLVAFCCLFGWVGVVLGVSAIDIGPGAIDRSYTWTGAGYTAIDIANGANGIGTLSSVELYVNAAVTGVVVGTFYGSGVSWTCRDWESIGSVAGGWHNFSVSISVSTDDRLGVYFASGTLERGNTGGNNLYYKAGNQMESGTQSYTAAAYTISIYGSGLSAVVPDSCLIAPESDENEVGTNHTLSLTVWGDDDNLFSGAGVSWNISGLGSILWSESVTGGDGVAECIIRSDVVGNSTVCGVVVGYSLSDCGSKEWVSTGGVEEEEVGIPLWYFVVVGVSLFAMWYTKDIVIGITAIAACAGGIWWAQGLVWEDVWIGVVSAVFVILAVLGVLFLVREGRLSV